MWARAGQTGRGDAAKRAPWRKLPALASLRRITLPRARGAGGSGSSPKLRGGPALSAAAATLRKDRSGDAFAPRAVPGRLPRCGSSPREVPLPPRAEATPGTSARASLAGTATRGAARSRICTPLTFSALRAPVAVVGRGACAPTPALSLRGAAVPAADVAEILLRTVERPRLDRRGWARGCGRGTVGGTPLLPPLVAYASPLERPSR